MDHDYLAILEETVGEQDGGWIQEDIQGAAGIRLALGLTRQNVEPVDSLLTRFPELQESIQEISSTPLAKSTMQNYKGSLKKLENFCKEFNYNYHAITEEIILHFMAQLNKTGASYAVITQMKPAIELMLEMQHGNAAIFTDRQVTNPLKLKKENRI